MPPPPLPPLPPPPPTIAIKSVPGSAKGRSIHATRAFAPGALITSFTPTLLVPPRAAALRVCNYCLATSATALEQGRPLRACVSCRFAAYCSVACQRAHWRLVHRRECPVLKILTPSSDGMPPHSRALVQALLLRDAGVNVGMDGLMSHIDNIRLIAKRWDDVMLQVKVALWFIAKAAGAADPTEAAVGRAAEMMCQLQTNVYGSTTHSGAGDGGLLFEPTLAMANHSCVPNAVMVHTAGRTVALHAHQAIAEGDEIEISYIDCTAPLAHRRRQLDDYFFRCCCPRCRDDLTVYDICRLSSPQLLDLNKMSFCDPAKLQSAPSLDAATRAAADRAYDAAVPLPKFSTADAAAAAASGRTQPSDTKIREQLSRCVPFIKEGLWALPAVEHLLNEILTLYLLQGRMACGLAVLCLMTARCTPFRNVLPASPHRTLELVSMAKFLSNTADRTAVRPPDPFSQDIVAFLDKTDQVSLCQMLLMMATRPGQLSHAPDWTMINEAHETITEIEGLPGRDREMSLIRRWSDSPDEPLCKAFFAYAVMIPINSLADLGAQLIMSEYGG